MGFAAFFEEDVDEVVDEVLGELLGVNRMKVHNHKVHTKMTTSRR